LLAHELAHVLQQGPTSSAATGSGSLEVAPPDGSLEREADRAADAAMSQRPVGQGDASIGGTVAPVRQAGSEGLVLREPTPKEGQVLGPFDEP